LNKAYKFRIYPNKEQQVAFSKTFGCTRMIYNYYLDKRIKLYQDEKITFGYTKCSNDMTALKQEREYLKEIDSIALQQALRHLDTAFQNFFKNKNSGFPKFKSKKVIISAIRLFVYTTT
jgi:putative transposase